MRPLLDEMYGPAMATALRDRGHLTLAVGADSRLRGMDDASVLQLAANSERTVVTENMHDFARLHGKLSAEGCRHAGIILVLAHRYPRRGRNVDRLASALDDFLTSPPSGLPDSFLWWLA